MTDFVVPLAIAVIGLVATGLGAVVGARLPHWAPQLLCSQSSFLLLLDTQCRRSGVAISPKRGKPLRSDLKASGMA